MGCVKSFFIIIGASITRLSLAHGLSNQGIPSEIFEKRGPGAPQRDWGITVHWAVEFLDLYPEGMEERLRSALVIQRKNQKHKIEGVPVNYNKTLESINELHEGVEAVFADGSRVTGSRRRWKPLTGFILNNFWMQFDAEKAQNLKDRLGNFMDIAPEEDSSVKRFELVKEVGKTFVEPFSTAIEWMPEGTYISPDRYGIWETKKWDHREGRIILAGDSAHSMTAHRAQGLNHSLQDVLNIVHGLEDIQAGKTSFRDFVDRYVDEVIARRADKVRMSLQQGLAVHNWGKNKDMPILRIGTTPRHMEQSVVPLTSEG
ncbi:hypothetical protein NKR23_g6076 [Pleurostoma richardsiae]|uniref:FAD-binding domain-containing protein n=1 Tax=Pleurostoma richardsiae TaxID=41990 RepID=A0AA38RDR7_9PEZI|nr:hypothetical protein NKR23_g6076 [Pleurostoma richardsiae]